MVLSVLIICFAYSWWSLGQYFSSIIDGRQGVTMQEHRPPFGLITKNMHHFLVLTVVEIRLGQKVKITVYKLIILHHWRGYIRDTGNQSHCDLMGAVLPASARVAALKYGVGRSELCGVLLDAHQRFCCLATTGLYLQIKISDTHFTILNYDIL